MRVGIITLNGYYNYGNRLQNYAMQQTLSLLGFEVDTIIINRGKRKNVLDVVAKQTLGEIATKGVTKLKRKINNFYYVKYIDERTLRFKNFTKMFINETGFSISESYIPLKLDIKYDYFVTGSDQVWNPHYTKGSPLYFLEFAPRCKRVAFSASFGISNLPKEYTERYRQGISSMAHISVRESAGAVIVKELTNRQVEVLVDPTLMLTREHWLSISRPAEHKPIVPYLLTYFLGDVPNDVRNAIREIANRDKLEVVEMATFRDKKRYGSDPSEFLDYINSARIIFTDSFHGGLFSMLFEKPFIITNRLSRAPSMESRVDELLSKFKLKSRKWDTIKNNRCIYEIDYSHIPQILDEERKKAMDYLKTAFGIIGE
jgi:hypothetical protein